MLAVARSLRRAALPLRRAVSHLHSRPRFAPSRVSKTNYPPQTAPPAHASILSANEAFAYAATVAEARSARPLWRVLVSAVVGGVLLSFSGALVITVVGGSPGLVQTAPGVAKLLAGAIFPSGLAMITLLQADLLTSNFLYYVLPGFADPTRSLSPRHIARIWGASLVGNALGSVVVAGACVATSLFSAPASAWAACAADAKVTTSPSIVFVKAIGANFLVNAAVMMSLTATTSGAKVASLWLPIGIFVTLGLEHCVANAFLVPAAKFSGKAQFSWGDATQHFVIVVAGNLVGALALLSLWAVPLAPARAAVAKVVAVGRRR